MNFGQSISTCMSKYVTFSGRASRSEYWWFYLFGVLLYLLFSIVDEVMFSIYDPMRGVIPGLVSLGLFLPTLSAGVRRLHDVNRSGWWFLIVFTIIGIIFLIVWMCTDSDKEKNFYGNNPKIMDEDQLNENENKSIQPVNNKMSSAGNISDKLKELNNLKEQGLISEDDYQKKKQSFLDEM